MENNIPSIIIAMPNEFDDKDVLELIKIGIEEESIPYEIIRKNNNDATELAYHAGIKSIIGVGVGIDCNGLMVIHTKHLKEDAPLFLINYKKEKHKIRQTAANAARLVKRVPFAL